MPDFKKIVLPPTSNEVLIPPDPELFRVLWEKLANGEDIVWNDMYEFPASQAVKVDREEFNV